MLPFGVQYGTSPDFMATVRTVLANTDEGKRIDAEIKDGTLIAKGQNGEYSPTLLINTFENDADRQEYSVNGYNVIVDLRPADTLAEIDAYCVSNDGKNTEISYEEYLALSDVARLNFDFKLRYTGRALELTDKAVEEYKSYVEGLGEEKKADAQKLLSELNEGKITGSEYNRGIYELYFVSYYPDITEYEGSSRVPLLRNYYYHQYLKGGAESYSQKHLLIFDDYVAGCFETVTGVSVSFYGFYSDFEDGALIAPGAAQDEAEASADDFIKDSFRATAVLNFYAHAVNVTSLVPYMALMLVAVALLTYSLLKLRGVESVASFGSMLKIVGSYTWFSGIISSLFTIILAFFIDRSILKAMPTVLFFIVLAIRSIVFAIRESRLYMEQLERREAEQTEV